MPFDFEQVYLLTNPSQNFMRSAKIALGVRPTRDRPEHSDDFVSGWQFLVDSDAHGGHQILGDIIRDEGGLIEVQDIDKRGEDGKPVVAISVRAADTARLEHLRAEGRGRRVRGTEEELSARQRHARLLP